MERLIRDMEVGETGYAPRLSLRFDAKELAYLVLNTIIHKKPSKDYPVRIKRTGHPIDNFSVKVPKFLGMYSYRDKNLLRKMRLGDNIVRLRGLTAKKLRVCLPDFF
jgi:hypothetical protein